MYMQLFGQICCSVFAVFGLYMAVRTVALPHRRTPARVVLELPPHAVAADVPLLLGEVRAACPFYHGQIEVRLSSEQAGDGELLAALRRERIKISE